MFQGVPFACQVRLPACARGLEFGPHLSPATTPSLCWESSHCLPILGAEVGEGRDGEREVGECLGATGEELVAVRLLLMLPDCNPGMSWDGRGFLVELHRQPEEVC